jgi:hypothetical protein
MKTFKKKYSKKKYSKKKYSKKKYLKRHLENKKTKKKFHKKKGGAKSSKKESKSDKIELNTIKEKLPTSKFFSKLNIDEDYVPSQKCIKLQKELDDYDELVKRNVELTIDYNKKLDEYHKDLEKWHNSQEYEDLLEGLYYSSLSDERRADLMSGEPEEPKKPELKIPKKPTKEFILDVAKECGKHFVQNI